MYVCELWDFSSKYTEFFYVAWCKSIRLLWSLQYRTHCNLLLIICDDLPVEYQLHIRFLKSNKSSMNTDNGLVNLCARLCMEDSMSDTGKCLTYICSKYGLIRRDVHDVCTRTLKHVVLAGLQTPSQKAVCAGIAIRESIHTREHIMDYNPFTLNELELLIHQTAT